MRFDYALYFLLSYSNNLSAILIKRHRDMKGKNKTKADKNLSLRKEKIQEIKKNLIRQKEALLSEAGIALNALPDETIFPELGDQASAEIDRNFMLRLKGRERQLLKKIDESIEKINSGTYGICEICGEEINIKRLEARPVTTMCIECKTEQEEEEKLRER
jgi:DnaK suppressor protein